MLCGDGGDGVVVVAAGCTACRGVGGDGRLRVAVLGVGVAVHGRILGAIVVKRGKGGELLRLRAVVLLG